MQLRSISREQCVHVDYPDEYMEPTNVRIQWASTPYSLHERMYEPTKPYPWKFVYVLNFICVVFKSQYTFSLACVYVPIKLRPYAPWFLPYLKLISWHMRASQIQSRGSLGAIVYPSKPPFRVVNMHGEGCLPS